MVSIREQVGFIMEESGGIYGTDACQEKSDGSAGDSMALGPSASQRDSDKEQLLRTSSDDINDAPQDSNTGSANGKGKPVLFYIRHPLKGIRLSETDDDEPCSETTNLQKSPAKGGKKFSRKGDHVTFEDVPEKDFEFVPKKASKFGLGTSSSDHNFEVLPDDDDDNGNSEMGKNIVSSHEANSDFASAMFLSSSKVPSTKSDQEKQESPVTFSVGKSEQVNRSFMKNKLSSPLRKRNSYSENKIEKSPLLGKPTNRSSPGSSIDSSLLRTASNEDGSQNTVLSSPLRSELEESSEEDSPFTNTSEDADHVLSPSIVSDDGVGICSKYSQLSEDGSSPSSPAKSTTVTVDEEEKEKPEPFKERAVFEHSLELGVAFTEFVDVDSFKASLGNKNPHTEDGFGGRSEEHLLILLRGGSRKGLKSYLRNSQWPAESDARRHLWEHLCNHLLKAEEHLYQELVDDLFPHGMNEDMMLPAFVDENHVHSYYLTTHGIQHVKTVINIICNVHPDIVYCPMLYPMSCLFLHYMAPEACFNCMQAMLSSTMPYYFTQTKIKTEASKYVLRDLAKKYAKQAYVLMGRSAKSVEAVFDNWMWWIFRDLPFQYLVRIIDSFLLEGYKVLYRISLAIVILFAKESARHGSRNSPVHNINAAISRFCKNMTVDPKRLIKVGFGIRGLSRKEITKLHDKNEAYIRSLPAKESVPRVVSSQSIGNISITRSFNGPRLRQHVASAILSPEMLQTIWQWIPVRLSLMRPKMLFSSDEHGTAIRTLYTRTEHAPQTILAIKTTNNEIFGAFCSSPWYTRHEKNKPHTSFFGTGETFVFTLYPETRRYPWVGTLGYPPEHTADLFMAGDDEMLVIGSGNGEAIYLDATMNRCSSTHCTTFDNEPLSSETDFSCCVVEVFGFVD